MLLTLRASLSGTLPPNCRNWLRPWRGTWPSSPRVCLSVCLSVWMSVHRRCQRPPKGLGTDWLTVEQTTHRPDKRANMRRSHPRVKKMKKENKKRKRRSFVSIQMTLVLFTLAQAMLVVIKETPDRCKQLHTCWHLSNNEKLTVISETCGLASYLERGSNCVNCTCGV